MAISNPIMADPREVVLRDFELFSLGRERIDDLLQCFSEDIIFQDCISDELHVGHEALRAYTLVINDALPDLKVQNVRLTVQGRTVVSEMEFVGTHLGEFMGVPATGRRLRWRNCTVYEINDQNRIAKERYYFDRGMILAQMVGDEQVKMSSKQRSGAE